MRRRTLLLGMAVGPFGSVDGRAEVGAEDRMDRFRSGGRDIAGEWFLGSGTQTGDKGKPAVLLLHGADGLVFAEGYRWGAQAIAAAGISVGFVHYLDRTGERRVLYSRLRESFPLWSETVGDALTWLGARPGVDPARLGIVGVSLGAALALWRAAEDPRIRAIVDYFGPVPEGLAARKPKLPPTLILHGAADPVVPVSHAHALAELLKGSGTPYEIEIYPGQAHGFVGPAQLDSALRVSTFLGRHLAGGVNRS